MCEKYFHNTVTRHRNGDRFLVHLPIQDNIDQLGKSYKIAKRHLLSMERKFERNKDLKNKYIQIVGKMYYSPHHSIRKKSSTSTKQPVVFDASCKT